MKSTTRWPLLQHPIPIRIFEVIWIICRAIERSADVVVWKITQSWNDWWPLCKCIDIWRHQIALNHSIRDWMIMIYQVSGRPGPASRLKPTCTTVFIFFSILLTHFIHWIQSSCSLQSSRKYFVPLYSLLILHQKLNLNMRCSFLLASIFVS